MADRKPRPKSTPKEISLPKKAREHQKRLRAHIKKQFAFQEKMVGQGAKDFTERANNAYAFQEEIFRRGLKASGIEYSDIEKRQKLDMKLALRNAKKRKAEIIRKSKSVQRQHKMRTKRRQALRSRFEKEIGNPRLSVFLCERVDHDFYGSGVYTTNPNSINDSSLQYINNPGENVTRWRIRIQNTSGGFARYTAFLVDEFAWMSDRNGVMDVEAIFSLNAAYDIGLVGMCFGHSAAELLVKPMLLVSQNVSGTTDLTLDNLGTSNALLDIDREAGCVGIVDSGLATPLETGEISLTRSNFPVQANKIVLVDVVLAVTAYGYNGGTVDFDFKSESSFEMDTPCVALIVDS